MSVLLTTDISKKTSPELITAYLRWWPLEHRTVVECATGWCWFCHLLRSLGVSIILARAKYLKAVSYAKEKTDAVDALTWARLLRMGCIPEAHRLPPEYRAMRDLLRQQMLMRHRRTNMFILLDSPYEREKTDATLLYPQENPAPSYTP
jgi:transposase